MAKQKIYETVLTASEWWAGVLRNGLKENDTHPLYRLVNQKPKLEEKMIKKFQKQLITILNKELNEFGLLSLYTKNEPKGLLEKICAKSHIYYKLYNPFPDRITMTLTKDSVLLKGKNGASTILYRNTQKNTNLEKE